METKERIITIFPVKHTKEGNYPLLGINYWDTRVTGYADNLTKNKLELGWKGYHLIAIDTLCKKDTILVSYTNNVATLSNGKSYTPIASTYKDGFLDLSANEIESFNKNLFSFHNDLRAYNKGYCNNTILTYEVKNSFTRNNVLDILNQMISQKIRINDIKKRTNLLSLNYD